MPIGPIIHEQLYAYGDLKINNITNQTLVVLPSCSVPLEHLMEENWDVQERESNHGNFRRVRHIRKLTTGEQTALYVKSPEYLFTGALKRVEKGNIWYGGSRSGEGYIYLKHPLVEAMADLEAIILLGLLHAGIHAEVPQAIVIHPDARRELIVQTVSIAYQYVDQPQDELSFNEKEKLIKKIGMIPEDYGSHNMLTNQKGYSVIIDVNRWQWPPYTNQCQQGVREIVVAKIKEKRGAG